MTMAQEEINRDDYIAYCKERAMQYLDDPQQAIASLTSDMLDNRHTQNHPALQLGMLLLMTGQLDTGDKLIKFIQGIT
jgi:hypothetical protein